MTNAIKTIGCPNCFGTGTTIHAPDGLTYYKDCRRCKGNGKLKANTVSELESIQLQAIQDRRDYWYDR